jgi:predicted hotdog family 3-hydroxylacyl-ACP dehydratase
VRHSQHRARKRVSITVNARAIGVYSMVPSVPQLPRSVRDGVRMKRRDYDYSKTKIRTADPALGINALDIQYKERKYGELEDTDYDEDKP